MKKYNRKGIRVEGINGNIKILCFGCNEPRPLYEAENEKSYYYRCRKCDVLVFIYKNGKMARWLEKQLHGSFEEILDEIFEGEEENEEDVVME